MSTINIRPTSSVYATYKRLSYQPWTAIAEFVDNSTQSFYDHQDELMAQKNAQGLTVTVQYISDPENGDRLEIYDNAFGMEWEDFQRAVVLDSPPQNTNGRNEFGMGLKTAACWFGSLWSVESTQLGSKTKYYTEINVDELGKHKTEEIDVKEEIVGAEEHFTRIVIKQLNKRIVGSRTVGKVKDYLSSIYRADLRLGYVKIYYNGTLLSFKEPPVFSEIRDGKATTWKKEISFSVDHKGKQLPVFGFIALRVPGSVRDAGFTLLRRGRVIVGGAENNYRPVELFGDSNSYTWQRLYGELHMDLWPVTQAKDNFDWHNSGLEEAFIDALKERTQDFKRKAESLRVRERVQTSVLINDTVQGLSNSGVVQNVDVHVVNNDQANQADAGQQSTASTSTEVQSLCEVTVADTNSAGVIIEGGNRVDFNFTYKRAEYLFHVNFEASDPSLEWLLVENNNDKEYTLSINMRHSFFMPLIEKKESLLVMTRMCIAMVLAEIEAMNVSPDGKIEPSDIRQKMNEILETVRKGDE